MKKASFGVLASDLVLIFCALLSVKDASAAVGDGIPDSWRVQYFGSVSDPRALATADPDGDGASNYQEYLGGTNPVDANSVPSAPISLETYAGSVAGSRDGKIAEATFTSPNFVRRDPQGRYWILEATWQAWSTPLVGAHRVRVLDPVAGTVGTLAGSMEPGYVDGPAATARFIAPTSLVFDSHGNAFIAERLGHRIRKIDLNQMVSTFAGSQLGNLDGQGTNAMFHSPNTMAIDGQDNLYVADFDNFSIRKISPDGYVTTMAGMDPGNVDGSLSLARFNTPCSLAIQPDLTLFVADWNNGEVRRISPAGQVSTFAAGLTYVEWVTVDAANHVYASLPDGPILKQYDINGQLLWSAQVSKGFNDGPIAQAKVGRFNALEVLPDGNILFPDGENNRIRQLKMGVPALVTMTPAGGVFTNLSQVSLSSIVNDGVVRYTLDGTEPTAVSPAYAVPLALSVTTTVKARVFVNGIPVSAVASSEYTLASSPSGASATRQLPANYLAGTPITVSIAVNPPADATAYAVEDQLPIGWQIGATISDDGQYDAQNRTVKFGPYIDSTARTLSYEAVPSVSGDVAVFAGSVSIDGAQNVIGGDCEITPALLHPADLQPADLRITVSELTAYAAAWKRGDTWSVAPLIIPVNYVTRAAYLWRNGETYRYDSFLDVAPPMDWVLDTNTSGKASLKSIVPHTVVAEQMSLSDTLQSLDEPANQAVATRPATYVPGRPFAVEIALQPLATTRVNAIEETIPAGWTASDISEGGTFDSALRKVKWGPFFDAMARVLRYQAVPSQEAAETVSFSGLASFDGVDVTLVGNGQIAPATASAPTATIRTDTAGVRNLSLGVTEPLGSVVRIEYSKDLKNWQTVKTQKNQTGTAVIDDSALLASPVLFFRIVPAE
jgi:sugar lactone lactonase YvrE